VFRSRRAWIFSIAILSACFAAGPRPAAAQHLQTIIESRGKDFPGVGAGVTALKRDSAGRYYVLAQPPTVISVYGADGGLLLQIPNAKSSGTVIRYAVDIDLSPEGQLYVADRGANCIEVFERDGSLVTRIPVVAPTSIVALSGGQVAVTSLVSKRLVTILDSRGKLVRSFGDPNDLIENSEKQSLINLGKISGDSAGGIYFAFTSVPDRTLRKYDRYGYVGYEASVSERLFAAWQEKPDDRVEFTVGFSEFSFSEQTNGWATFGSSGDLKFGGGVGTGLGESLRRGYGFGQAVQQQSTFGTGLSGGPVGAQVVGQANDQGVSFQPIFGTISAGAGGGRGRGRAGGGFGSFSSDSGTPQGPTLQFLAPGGDSSDSADAFNTGPGTSVLSMNAGADQAAYANGSGSALNTDALNQGNSALGQEGLPAAFVVATLFDSTSFGGPGRFGNFGGGGGGGFGRPPGLGRERAGGGFGGGAGGFEGGQHGGYRGRFGSTSSSFTSRVRVNLGDLGGGGGQKPVITAMAADPETHEIWAAMGGALVQFSREGDPVGVYYPTISGATGLKPVALLVEPDRILVAADPWGIFEFARPDKPQASARHAVTAAAQGNSSQN